MTTRYESTQTLAAAPLTLIFPEGTFEALPYEIRLMGPWFGCSYGDIASLKPAHRGEMLRRGYALIRESASLRSAA